MKKSNKKLLGTAVTGIIGAAFALSTASFAKGGAAPAAEPSSAGKYKCEGGNSCKEKGDCGGKAHDCAHKNTCKGQGFVFTTDKAACDKMKAALKKG